MDKILDIDNVDLKIISLLNDDAKTPYTEIAKKVSASISKFNCEANLTARIILRGSSEKVIPGSSGVLIFFRLKSPNPSNGSISSP